VFLLTKIVGKKYHFFLTKKKENSNFPYFFAFLPKHPVLRTPLYKRGITQRRTQAS